MSLLTSLSWRGAWRQLRAEPGPAALVIAGLALGLALALLAASFLQDTLEYGTRTHHSNADLYDRAQKADLQQGSLVEAWFAYNAATRPQMLPRLPTPEPLKK